MSESPPTSPAKRFNFSVDSLLSTNNEERRISKTADNDDQIDNEFEHEASDLSGRSTPQSDLSVNDKKSTDPVSLSMAAAWQQRTSFMKHTAPQLPHSALLYPWLMSAGLMTNQSTAAAAALLSTNSQQQSSREYIFSCLRLLFCRNLYISTMMQVLCSSVALPVACSWTGDNSSSGITCSYSIIHQYFMKNLH